MPTKLVWQQLKAPDGTLPDDLKRVLSRTFWKTRENPEEVKSIATKANIPYLKRLHNLGISGADELINLINKHDKVQLWFETETETKKEK